VALTGLPVARLKLLSEQILVDRYQLEQRANFKSEGPRPVRGPFFCHGVPLTDLCPILEHNPFLDCQSGTAAVLIQTKSVWRLR